MPDVAPQPNADGVTKLTGTVRNLKVTRASASFVFTKSDQTKMGVVAFAAAMAGLGGPAIATASNASAMEEEADYLEFDLDGRSVKGWVWRNPPFREGDVVDVAAQVVGDHWEAYGVARPSDRTVALYPHCSRGRSRHFRNALKWWILGGGGAITLVGIPLLYLTGGDEWYAIPGKWTAASIAMAFFGLMTAGLSWKWMPFVRVAEKVFRALDLPNPSNIDLVKSSKAQRKADDPGEFGTFYFRY